MRNIWFKKKHKKKDNASLLDISDITASADHGKLDCNRDVFTGGLNNYILFQRFNSYYWPLWLTPSLKEHQKRFHPAPPLHLRNTENRDYLVFTNFLSPDYLRIDPSGMISPAGSCWSIELWMLVNSTLYRPQLHMDQVSQERYDQDCLATTRWEHNLFKLSMQLYGTRTSIDEAIVDIKCASMTRGASGTSLVVSLRPYTIESLGGLDSIEYRESAKIIRINKKEAIYFNKNPRDVFAGSGTQGDLKFKKRQEKTSCVFGMATMALVYPIKKEGFELKLRLGLTRGKSVDALKLNYNNVRKDFIDYCSLVQHKGFNVSIAEDTYVRWFQAMKMNALNAVNNLISSLKHDVNKQETRRDAFYLVKALGRMGYTNETRSILESWCRSISVPEAPVFIDLINFSYFISGIADHFTITRDVEFLQSNFDRLRVVSSALLKHACLVTHSSKTQLRRNSLHTDFTATSSIHDLLLLFHSFNQYSYLCRTIGLFGDEIRFNGECKKISEIIAAEIQDVLNTAEESKEGIVESGADRESMCNENIVYTTFCLFPFHVEGVKIKEYRKILDAVAMTYEKYPLFIRSGGYWDMFLTVMLGNNLLINRDPGAHEILEIVQNLGGNIYSVSDRIHPVTLSGMDGSGDSICVNSAIFLLMRNMLLIDSPTRLELFPIPREEWFRPGSEIVLENAPTRFGNINLKLVSTQNEIQLFFNDLPKYIPPDIMINLPCKMLLRDGDDFVLKKEEGNAFIINGWPSVVRFGKI